MRVPSTFPAAIAAAAVLLAVPALQAQEAEAGGIRSEPRVQRIVIEDDGARIEELRVRGQTRRITVQPKGPASRYEIVTPDGARDLSDGVDSSRGAAGKRVWNVLSF